jgi:hypothetical protein
MKGAEAAVAAPQAAYHLADAAPEGLATGADGEDQTELDA